MEEGRRFVRGGCCGRLFGSRGFGLIELLVVLVIVTLLASVALPMYDRFVTRAKVAAAIGDISWIGLEIEEFRLRNDSGPPLGLDELGMDLPLDPWGRPYQYLNIAAAGSGVGGLRKDANLNPLNTDYDLYSLGKDGDSKGPLNAQASRDDIVRANNGAFIGKGEDY